MELIEKHELRKIHFLNEMSFKEFKQINKSCKNDEERKIKFNNLKSFCETNIKTMGRTKRIYSYSLSTDQEAGGRLYCGNSIQGLQSDIRGFLMTHTTDIDMKNCHPVILRYICKLHNILCPNLECYISNRDEILSQMENKDEGKIAFLKAVNDDKFNTKIRNKFFKDFDKEMKHLQAVITTMETYKNITSTVPATRLYNWNGSAINRILCMFENRILQVAIDSLNHRGIEICCPMFDGIMPYGDYYNDEELLAYITAEVASKFEDLNMGWAYKPHSTVIQIPEDFKIPDKPVKLEISKGKDFNSVAVDFEKTHCKIVNKALYIKETDNDETIMMSYQHLITAYSHLSYIKIVDGKFKNCPFIPEWTGCSHNIRRYEDIGIYPEMSLCPKSQFNLWKPFAMEKVIEWVDNQTGLTAILNHIKILCNNDVIVYDYFIKWIAQMIQYPHIKSICPTLISKQGAGKGTLLILLKKMLGEAKVLETTTPSRDVWGQFNGVMTNAFLVNLNELSKKETIEAEGVIKGLITDDALTINNKGINQYKIKSHHRFIITTNKEEPVNTSADDRRNLIIRSSDEKLGDKDYFNQLYEYLENVDVVRTCYEYFKNIPDMNDFKRLDMPVTEYQSNLKELSRTPPEMWLIDFTTKNADKETVEMLGAETFNSFKSWAGENGYETYNINCLQLGVKISNLRIDGVEKGRHTNVGWTKLFNISKLKKHFNIGCLISYESKNGNEDCEDSVY